MADEVKAPVATDQGAPAAAEIKNLKAEFDRKVSNLETANRQLMNQMAAMTPKPLAPAAPDLGDLMFSDPAKAVAIIKEQAKSEMRQEISVNDAAKERFNGAVSSLYKDFPEFSDSENPLTKKALERYGNYSEEDKKDPKSLRIAALETAMEMGVKPRAQRTDNDDSFSFGGGSTGGQRRQKKAGLDPRTVEYARLSGMDVSDPKVIARLEKRAADLEARSRKE